MGTMSILAASQDSNNADRIGSIRYNIQPFHGIAPLSALAAGTSSPATGGIQCRH
jgi:hypothetical protein